METKGNPVDSVIQYQLHKKTSGEGGDSFKCNYQEPYRYEYGQENVVITQELYDSDEVIKSYVDNNIISIGDIVTKCFITLTPEIILSGRKLITLNQQTGIFMVDEYGVINENILSLIFEDDFYIIGVDESSFNFTINSLTYNGYEFVSFGVPK